MHFVLSSNLQDEFAFVYYVLGFECDVSTELWASASFVLATAGECAWPRMYVLRRQYILRVVILLRISRTMILFDSVCVVVIACVDVETFCGSGVRGFNGDAETDCSAVQFSHPYDIIFDAYLKDRLIVADMDNCRIREIDLATSSFFPRDQ
jgi:hypothetical protein